MALLKSMQSRIRTFFGKEGSAPQEHPQHQPTEGERLGQFMDGNRHRLTPEQAIALDLQDMRNADDRIHDIKLDDELHRERHGITESISLGDEAQKIIDRQREIKRQERIAAEGRREDFRQRKELRSTIGDLLHQRRSQMESAPQAPVDNVEGPRQPGEGSI